MFKAKSESDIAIEIIKVIQGPRSSAQFSQDLEFKTNQVHRWISGHTALTWDAFIKVCLKSKIPFQERLVEGTILKEPFTDFKSFYSVYFPHITKSAFAKHMNVSPATITKWFAGRSSPVANDFFRFLKTTRLSLTPFLFDLFCQTELL